MKKLPKLSCIKAGSPVAFVEVASTGEARVTNRGRCRAVRGGITGDHAYHVAWVDASRPVSVELWPGKVWPDHRGGGNKWRTWGHASDRLLLAEHLVAAMRAEVASHARAAVANHRRIVKATARLRWLRK